MHHPPTNPPCNEPIAVVTPKDCEELLSGLRPNAHRMTAILRDALSTQGMRQRDHGWNKYAYEATDRAEVAAVQRGFVVEHLPLGPRGGMRMVIRYRWLPQFRAGLSALLEWNERDGRVTSPGLARSLSQARHAAAPLLLILGREPDVTEVLPRWSDWSCQGLVDT